MFDLVGAKKEGYTDTEIAEYLSSKKKFDIEGAKKEGYSDAEIINHLSNWNKTIKPELEKKFEGGGLEQPWIDPISAGAGGFGAGVVGSKVAGVAPRILQGLISGGASAIADLPAGIVTEKVAEKYPALALPTAIATGLIAGKLVQSPIEKQLGKYFPSQASKVVPKVSEDILPTPKVVEIVEPTKIVNTSKGKSEELQNILAKSRESLLKEFPNATPEEISKKLDLPVDTIKQIMGEPKAGSLAFGQELPKYTLGGEGNINLERMDSSYAVKKTINDIAEQYNIVKTKRTWQEIQDEADSIGLDTVRALKDKPKGIANEAWIQAKRDLHVDSATRLRALQEQYAGKPLTDQDIASIRLAMEQHAGIQAQVSSNASEAGRALNIHRKMAKAQTTVEGYKTILEGMGGRELNREMVEKFLLIDPDNKLAVAKFVRDATRAKTGDMLYEAWINSLLTSPASHIANVTGNTITNLFKPIVETPLIALLQKGKSLVTGKEPTTYFGESLAQFKGFKDVTKAFLDETRKAGTFGKWQGIKDGVRAAVNSFAKQLPDDIALAGKIEQVKRQAIPGKIGEIIRSPGSALQLADDMFKAIAYRGELNAQAYKIATREGIKGSDKVQRIAELLANPTEEMTKAGSKEALYRTFNNPNALASWLMKGKNLPVIGTPMKYILPFVRTPTNIAKFALERTPLALPWTRTTEDLARIGAGSMLGAMTIQLVSEGFITGGGPKDKEQKAALYRTGWKPYSLHVGDKYLSFNRLEPLGTIMGMSADLKEMIDGNTFTKEEDRTINKMASQIALSFTKNISSKTFLQGLTNTVEALSEPERYSEKLGSQLIGSTVPSVVGSVARAIDPTLREIETPIDVLKSRTPVLSKTLLPKRDIWGREITRGGTPMTNIFSPMLISKDTKDPIDKEMLKLGIEIAQPSKKVRGVELTSKEYDKFSVIAGQEARKRVESYMRSPQYTMTRKEIKEKVIKKLIEASRQIAFGKMLPEIGVERVRDVKLKEYGLQGAIK